MADNLTAISVARMLHEQELFYFSSRTLADLLGRDLSQIHPLVRQLVRAGLVAEIENGKYLLLGFEPERVLANPLFIGSHLVTPGYVSYWSALHTYGFTEQVPLIVYVATTRKKPPVEYAGQRFRFVTIHPRVLRLPPGTGGWVAGFDRRRGQGADRQLERAGICRRDHGGGESPARSDRDGRPQYLGRIRQSARR